MSARILKAEAAAQERREVLQALRGLTSRPKIVAVHSPSSPAARWYLRAQQRVCAEAGVQVEVRPIGTGWELGRVRALLDELNSDPGVSGISVHTPLPAGIDLGAVMDAITPGKDIEGIHPQNLGRLAFGGHRPAPCAASSAVALARAACPSFRGLSAVVVGRSPLVGKAIALLLLGPKADAPTVTLCHSGTADLGAHTRRADLLFAAAGRPELIRGDMIKPGAVVIDLGINEMDGGKLVGDVAFDEALEVAGAITPVPGGVGPVCHIALLENLLACLRAR